MRVANNNNNNNNNNNYNYNYNYNNYYNNNNNTNNDNGERGRGIWRKGSTDYNAGMRVANNSNNNNNNNKGHVNNDIIMNGSVTAARITQMMAITLCFCSSIFQRHSLLCYPFYVT